MITVNDWIADTSGAILGATLEVGQQVCLPAIAGAVLESCSVAEVDGACRDGECVSSWCAGCIMAGKVSGDRCSAHGGPPEPESLTLGDVLRVFGGGG
ncbi:MAG: hypothetical protein OXH28_10995 [bacterium]|nr:hypothetical protein [bacterium]